VNEGVHHHWLGTGTAREQLDKQFGAPAVRKLGAFSEPGNHLIGAGAACLALLCRPTKKLMLLCVCKLQVNSFDALRFDLVDATDHNDGGPGGGCNDSSQRLTVDSATAPTKDLKWPPSASSVNGSTMTAAGRAPVGVADGSSAANSLLRTSKRPEFLN